MIHVHQGGTLYTYCGRSVKATDVSWDSPQKAECVTCRIHQIQAQRVSA